MARLAFGGVDVRAEVEDVGEEEVEVGEEVVGVGDVEVEADGASSCVLVADVGADEGGEADLVESPGDVLQAAISTTDDAIAVARQIPTAPGPDIVTPLFSSASKTLLSSAPG